MASLTYLPHLAVTIPRDYFLTKKSRPGYLNKAPVMNSLGKASSLRVVFSLSVLISSSSVLMAEELEKSVDGDLTGESTAVHIVYVDRPEGEEPEAFHIRTLASVVGSEEAAKEAVVYHYKHAASGFSARLTPKQVEDLSQQPGVLQVMPDRILQLHSGGQPGGRVGHMGLV